MTETAAARSGFSAAGSRFLCSHVLGRPGVGTADTRPDYIVISAFTVN